MRVYQFFGIPIVKIGQVVLDSTEHIDKSKKKTVDRIDVQLGYKYLMLKKIFIIILAKNAII